MMVPTKTGLLDVIGDSVNTILDELLRRAFVKYYHHLCENFEVLFVQESAMCHK